MNGGRYQLANYNNDAMKLWKMGIERVLRRDSKVSDN